MHEQNLLFVHTFMFLRDTSQTSLPSAASLEQVKEEKLDIPAEYDQIQENGSIYFVHKVTQEKVWHRIVFWF